MNTFFRICVYYCIVLLMISLCINLVNTFDAFETADYKGGLDVGDGTNPTGKVIADTTDYSNMGTIFGLLTIGTGIGLAIGWITSSVVPIGIGIFAGVFWASYGHMQTVLSGTQYISPEIMTVFTICTAFIFVAAIIGMATGSG